MNWDYVNLGDVCKTGAGGTPLKSKNEYYENGTIPWLRSGEVNNRNIIECEVKITEEGLLNSSAKLFPPRTVLIAMYGATAGEVGILNFECSTNQAVCGILPNKQFIPEFLYYFFLDFKNDLISQAVGNAQPNISQAKIKKTSVPLISVEKQKQIVAILENAFAAIELAKTNIEKNIQNAQELFQSYKEKCFNDITLNSDTKPLIDACEAIYAGGDAPKDNFSKDKTDQFSIPVIANAVKKNGLYGFTNKARVTKPSITVAARGSGTGHTEFRDYPFVPIVRLIVLTPDADVIVAEYLMYAIKSLVIERSGSAIPQLTVPMMKSYSIPVPKIKEQNKIILQFNDLKEFVDNYIEKLLNKLLEIDELKKSILQKAFAGELVQ